MGKTYNNENIRDKQRVLVTHRQALWANVYLGYLRT